MKYLLDTCVVSDFVKGDTHTLAHIKSHSPADIAISSITVFEIQYGLALNSKHAAKIKGLIQDLFSSIHILDFTSGDAEITAITRAQLKQQGRPIGAYDILIAGVAMNNNLILVSSNLKEFARLRNLKIVNWRTR